jgi:hypothetical protein
MFFALFFGNEKLAQLTNMTNENSNGIYDYLLEHCKLLFVADLNEESLKKETLDFNACKFFEIMSESRDF